MLYAILKNLMMMMIEEERGGGKCLDFELFSVLFFMKEKIDFSQPILMRNEKEKRKKQKQKQSLAKKKKRKKTFIFYHTHLKEPSS